MKIPVYLFILSLALSPESACGLQNLFKPVSFGGLGGSVSRKTKALEDELLSAISDEGSRLANSESVASLIGRLKSQNPTPEPAIAPRVYGRWRLLYTNNADTSSPIQRSAVNAQKYSIYQDIIVNDNTSQLQVNQVVKFSDSVALSVDALASTAAYPLEELTERKSGTTFGLSILGVSLVGKEAEPDPERPNSRISFVFDEGNFDFGSFRIPYPVPFRLPLLRDAVKGWIDITYLSERLRIARGNKGTTFVLLKENDNIA
mmetsp:Transcript_20801/g.26874  ORF Transcript_20801/g.26874 Transcript_20801/m.26874 type:complete len:261 (-) Transcript_20801:227-1009(-)